MKPILSIQLIALLLISITHVPAEAISAAKSVRRASRAPASVSLTPPRRMLLSFAEYKGLNSEQQQTYLKMLGSLVADLEKSAGSQQANNGLSELKEFFGLLVRNSSLPFLSVSLITPAQAATAAEALAPDVYKKAGQNKNCLAGYVYNASGYCALEHVNATGGTCPSGYVSHPNTRYFGQTICYKQQIYESWKTQQENLVIRTGASDPMTSAAAADRNVSDPMALAARAQTTELAASTPPISVKSGQAKTCLNGYVYNASGDCALDHQPTNANGSCETGYEIHPDTRYFGNPVCYKSSFRSSWLAKKTPIAHEAAIDPMKPLPATNNIANASSSANSADAGISTTSKPTPWPWADELNSQLICIYAGFPIRRELTPTTKCSPPSSYVNEKSVDGEKTAYTCLSEDAFKDTDQAKGVNNVVTTAQLDPNKTVLCNPMLFGLDITTDPSQPICIERSATATKNCNELAEKIQAKNSARYIKERSQLILKNPKVFDKIKFTLERLCSGDAEYEKELENSLVLRGRDVKSSKKDIANTCAVYHERITENGWLSGPATRGRRAGAR